MLVQDYGVRWQQQLFWWNNWRGILENTTMQGIYLQKVISATKTITEIENVNIKPGGYLWNGQCLISNWEDTRLYKYISFPKFYTLTTPVHTDHTQLRLSHFVLRTAAVHESWSPEQPGQTGNLNWTGICPVFCKQRSFNSTYQGIANVFLLCGHFRMNYDDYKVLFYAASYSYICSYN